MFNLIKSECYKALHLRSVRVMFLIVLVFGLSSGFLLKTAATMTDSLSAEDAAQLAENLEGMPAEIRMGIYTPIDSSLIKDGAVNLWDVASSDLNGGTLQLLVAILTALFVSVDFTYGFIENIAGHAQGKGKLVIPKLLVLTALVAVMFLLYLGTGFLSARIAFGDILYVSDSTGLARYLGLQLLLHIAFAFVIAFLCFAVRSLPFDVAAGVLLSSGIVAMAFRVVDLIAKHVFGVAQPDTGVISISRAISEVMPAANDAILRRGLIIGCVYLAAAAVLSFVVMQRRDIA
ncbi:MAG: hypothetical protein IJQ26_07035 [Lachnospiraceae bacterium]|nr:hypothetical protein [Lachnospiraceae bacterium]